MPALPSEEKECAREQIAVYNQNYRLFQQGDYYRITSPYANHDVTVWTQAPPDMSGGYIPEFHTAPAYIYAGQRPAARQALLRNTDYPYSGSYPI